jgi:four helix bundle protein
LEITVKNFRDLMVWQKAHTLTLASYRGTAEFPRQEIYGLTSQIRRCSASIAANIAEGCGKRGNAEFQRFLNIAAGSASELEYHFLLAKDLGFLDEEEYKNLDQGVVEVKRMLAGLIKKIEAERQG